MTTFLDSYFFPLNFTFKAEREKKEQREGKKKATSKLPEQMHLDPDLQCFVSKTTTTSSVKAPKYVKQLITINIIIK